MKLKVGKVYTLKINNEILHGKLHSIDTHENYLFFNLLNNTTNISPDIIIDYLPNDVFYTGDSTKVIIREGKHGKSTIYISPVFKKSVKRKSVKRKSKSVKRKSVKRKSKSVKRKSVKRKSKSVKRKSVKRKSKSVKRKRKSKSVKRKSVKRKV
jgi:hypothetical protein